MSEFAKCCYSCGRWGNRGYRWDGERESWICTNDHACAARLAAQRPTLAPTEE